MDTIYTTLPLFDHPDPVIRHAVILSRIATSLFLLGDHLLWLGRADVYNINTQKWSRISNKYWLMAITMNLVRDFCEIYRLIKIQKDIVPSNGIRNVNDVYAVLSKTVNVVCSNKNVLIDTIKNGCDFFIPLSALGHVNFAPGTIGWLGVISSLAGLSVLVDPKIKLSPS